MCKITIAIPVYNVEKQVKRSLLSALNQDFGDYEIIIIDDKGTDHSIDIVKEVVQSHEKGKIVSIIDHGVNRGTGATKNTAIDKAKGEYIYFMDSDDVISHDCLNRLYAKAIAYNVDIVAGSHAICSDKLGIRHRASLYDIHRQDLLLSDYCIAGNGYWTPYTWNKLYKLSFLKDNKIRCIPHHLCEDMFFTFQVKLCCTSFATCSDITYAYVDNPSSLMGRGFNERLLTQIGEVLDKQQEYLVNNGKLLQNMYIKRDFVMSCINAIDVLEDSDLISASQRIELRKIYSNILSNFVKKHMVNDEGLAYAIKEYNINGDYALLEKYSKKIAQKTKNVHSLFESFFHYIVRVKNKILKTLQLKTMFTE